MTDYLIRTVIETWWEPVLRQLVLLEQYYETDETVLGVCAQKARLFPRFGMSAITDHILANEVNVSVNVGMGSSDPAQRFQKFMMATEAAMKIRVAAAQVPGANVEEMTKELYSNAGYRDGARFFTDKIDPKLAQAMQMVAQMKGLLEGKQLELQSSERMEAAKLQSQERTKAAELQVDARRIEGDLSIRSAEIELEKMRVDLERLKIEAESGKAGAEQNAKIVEAQAKVEEMAGKLAIEKEKNELEREKMQIERERMATDAALKKEDNEIKKADQEARKMDVELKHAPKIEANKTLEKVDNFKAEVSKELSAGIQEMKKAVDTMVKAQNALVETHQKASQPEPSRKRITTPTGATYFVDEE